MVFYAYIDPFRNIPGLTMGKIGVSGTKVTMESPKLNGFRNDSRPYEVTATAATQDILKPNLVELKDLRARIVTDDKGGAAKLEAAFGILNTEKEQMNLRQDVKVRTDAGQEVEAPFRLYRLQGRHRDVGGAGQRSPRQRRHRCQRPRRDRERQGHAFPAAGSRRIRQRRETRRNPPLLLRAGSHQRHPRNRTSPRP